jgi:tryptophan synthase alpha chain
MAAPRLADRFAQLKREGRAGLIVYVMASDPDTETAFEILRGLPAAGADVIELGFPFTDPMADGPAIQKAALRALATGGSLRQTLDLVRRFRAEDTQTPLILMGYANPVEQMGHKTFADAALAAGVDGAIIVDLPPEEDSELRTEFQRTDLSLIRLATPTTDANRLPRVLEGSSGFLYYVSVTGVTGGKAVGPEAVRAAVARLRAATELPIAVGFGVRDAASASAIARVADAVVIGSAFVEEIATGAAGAAARVHAKVAALAAAVRGARGESEKTIAKNAASKGVRA